MILKNELKTLLSVSVESVPAIDTKAEQNVWMHLS